MIVKFAIEEDDTFCRHFHHFLVNHPSVEFASYQRGHFLLPDVKTEFYVIHDDITQWDIIKNEIKLKMMQEITSIENNFIL